METKPEVVEAVPEITETTPEEKPGNPRICSWNFGLDSLLFGGSSSYSNVQEKKKAQEACKYDPDALVADDDEDYGYDPELRYRDSYPHPQKGSTFAETDSVSRTVRLWNLCQEHDKPRFGKKWQD